MGRMLCILAVVLMATSCGPRGRRGGFGDRGEVGLPGAPGENGKSCTVSSILNGAIINCEDGTSSIVYNGTNGVDGADGSDGSDGTDGADGQDGQDGQNGQDGADGADGEDGQDLTPGMYAITEVVVLCPSIAGSYKEVLLRLGSGQLMAHYSHGNMQFLTLIGAGSYQSTDGRGCNFTVGTAPTYNVTF